jgi:hypothetical protein
MRLSSAAPFAGVSGFSYCIFVVYFVLLFLSLLFVGFSLPILLWFYLVAETFAFVVHFSLITDPVKILTVPPHPEPPLGGCCRYQVEFVKG